MSATIRSLRNPVILNSFQDLMGITHRAQRHNWTEILKQVQDDALLAGGAN
ncbi:MAG: hypothetical protein WA979_14970 [Pacificimonas sp.]